MNVSVQLLQNLHHLDDAGVHHLDDAPPPLNPLILNNSYFAPSNDLKEGKKSTPVRS